MKKAPAPLILSYVEYEIFLSNNEKSLPSLSDDVLYEISRSITISLWD